MTRSRSLWIALAVAVGLWLFVALSWRSQGPSVDQPVPISGLRDVAIDSFELSYGGENIRLERAAGGGFAVDGRAVAPRVVDDLVATLGYSVGRRRKIGSGHAADFGLDTPTAVLRVSASGRDLEFRRGSPVASDRLVWIGVGDDAVLITEAEADMLFPPANAIIDRRVFRLGGVALSKVVIANAEGESVVLSGQPLALISGRSAARLDPARLRAMLRPLRLLTIDFAPAPPQRPSGLALEMEAGGNKAFMRVIGACPDGRALVDSSSGAGCVDFPGQGEIASLAADPTPILAGLLDSARTPLRATLARGEQAVEIDFRGEGRVAARAWLALLEGPRQLAPELGAPLATIEIEYDDDESDSIEVSSGAARLVGEPFAWRLDPVRAAEVTGIESWVLRGRALSSRDPSEIRAVRVDGRAIDLAALGSEVSDMLAHLEALRFIAARPTASHRLTPPRRTISVSFAPPPIATGDPNELTLELGAELADGCAARLAPDLAVFLLEPRTCAALSAL